MTTTKDIAEPGPLMAGKRGLVMGVANDRSIAWGIARVLHGQGAELAFSYQGGAFGRRAVPLAQSIGSKSIVEADVEDLDSVKRVFEAIRKEWGSLDFVVHALAFSDRNELKGRYCDTTRKNFEHTMVISCFSFTEICKLAANMMPNRRYCQKLRRRNSSIDRTMKTGKSGSAARIAPRTAPAIAAGSVAVRTVSAVFGVGA